MNKQRSMSTCGKFVVHEALSLGPAPAFDGGWSRDWHWRGGRGFKLGFFDTKFYSLCGTPTTSHCCPLSLQRRIGWQFASKGCFANDVDTSLGGGRRTLDLETMSVPNGGGQYIIASTQASVGARL